MTNKLQINKRVLIEGHSHCTIVDRPRWRLRIERGVADENEIESLDDEC